MKTETEEDTMKVTKLDDSLYEKVTIEIKMRWTPLIKPMIAVLQNRDAPKSSHAEITNEFLRLAGVADALADAREVEGVVSLVARAKQFTDRQDYLANRRSLFYCGEEIPYEKFGDQVVLNGNRKDYDPEVNALIYDLYPDVTSIQHNSGWYSRGDGQLKPENN